MTRSNTSHTFFSEIFGKLGRIITKYTTLFLLFPIFLTLLLATGLQNLNIDFSLETFIIEGGVVDTYQTLLLQLFPMDVTYKFEPGRLLKFTQYGSIIVEAMDKGSVFRKHIFQDIIMLDRQIRNIAVKEDDEEWYYADICAKRNGNCFINKILLLQNVTSQIENGTLQLEYPIGRNRKDYGGFSLGGVKVNENGHIVSARAISLFYFLNNRQRQKERIAKLWEKLFVDRIENLKFKNILIEKDISSSIEDSNKTFFRISTSYVTLSIILMLLFIILSCLSPDFLRSKPWTGIASILSIGMSLISGFGFLSYIGIEMTALTMVVPFLILGVGMDDTFIMLSAWRKTDEKKLLEERISEMYFASGLSISVTSLTNIISFATGMIFSKIPMFRVFLLYGSVCLLFDYIYQISFIGAIFVLCGRAEERRLHSFAFIPLEKFVSSGEKRLFRRIFCFVKDEDTRNENNHNRIFRFNNFWEKLGNFMTSSTTKTVVIAIYCLYVATAIWNLSKQSTEATLNLSPIYGTYRYSYYEKYKEYYNHYEYRLQIIITQELNYADSNVQENIEGMMQVIENDALISDSILTESWLRTYLQFLSDRRTKLFLTGFNLTDSKDFLFVLRHFFLRIPTAENFKQDIAFDKNFTNIISTRFLVQTNFTMDDNLFYKQLVQLRKKLDKNPYAIIIYHPLFFCFDFADTAIISAEITLLIVAIVIFLITCFLLPRIICIVSVLLSIFSIVAGILGYMILWGLNINFYAITYLTLSIGFSIDYVVHVSSAYLLSKEVDPNRRLVETITLIGKPILQSSLSTIIAVLCALKLPSKDIRDCLKICILTFAIAAIHGILFLPTTITLLDSLCQTIHGNTKKKEMRCTNRLRGDIKLQGVVNKTMDDDL